MIKLEDLYVVRPRRLLVSRAGSGVGEGLELVLVPKGHGRRQLDLGVALVSLLKREGVDFGAPLRVTVEPVLACRACGCTEDRACAGGCAWDLERSEGPDLICTACTAAGKR